MVSVAEDSAFDNGTRPGDMKRMLSDIVRYLDEYLRTATVHDYPGAWNGLQIENRGEVTRLGAAVDACEAVMVEAVRRGVDLLLVHHGLFWVPGTLTGAMYRKTRAAYGGNMALYSSHLPLDLHPEVGNNALLCSALGVEITEPFLAVKGQSAGLRGCLEISRDALVDLVKAAVGGPVHLCPGGPEFISRVGVCTGGAGGEAARAAAEGVDTFITGEGPHHSWTLAEELGINLLYAGHYATETFGVRALAAHAAAKFGLPWEWIDHPTGL